MLAFVFSFCLIVFSGACINASAALSDGAYMDPGDFLNYVGQTISFTYWNGSEYTSGTASYTGTSTVSGLFSEDSSETIVNGAIVLKYQATGVNYKNTQGYITIDASPLYSIIDTTQLHAFIGVSSHNLISSSAYLSPQWDWNFGHFENDSESSLVSGYQSYFKIQGSSVYFPYVEVNEDFQTLSSVYSTRATFYGNSSSGYNNLTIAVGVPYVSSGASGAAGTLPSQTTTTAPVGGSGDINVSVEVDMSETNGLLGGIQQTLSGLVQGIADIFTPTQNFIESWKTNVVNLFYEVFAPYEGTKELLDNFANDLFSYGAAETVEFPGFSVPGTSFSVASYSVPLKPASMSGTFAILRTGFNILATLATINLIMTKVKAFLVGEKVVEVEGVDDEC